MNKKNIANKGLKNLLTETEYDVLVRHLGLLYYEPMSLTEIAKFTGESKETTRRRKVSALDKLRESPKVRELFKDFTKEEGVNTHDKKKKN